MKQTTLNIGDIVYFLESNRTAVPVEIIRIQNEFCIIHYINRNGGTKLRKTKLFKTKEEALLSRISAKYYSRY